MAWDIEHNGHYADLNPELLKQQNVSEENRLKLIESHKRKFDLMNAMQATDDVAELRALAKEIDDLEFYQQELWGFPKDPNYHYWFSVPKCSCSPKNCNLYGTPERYIAEDCLIHSPHIGF